MAAAVELGRRGVPCLVVEPRQDVSDTSGAFGSFMHQGQICMTTGRHLVDARIAADYTAALAEHAERLPVGNPATEQVALGPLIDEHQRDRVHSMVTETVAAGATLAAGGRYEGLFYRPTVLADVPTSARAGQPYPDRSHPHQ